MIRLSILTGTERVESRRYPGVFYTLRRLGSDEFEIARQAATQAIRAARDGLEALAPYGFDGPDAHGRNINPRDAVQMMGVGARVGAVEVMMRALESWEGVERAPGVAAPIDRPHLSLILQDIGEHDFLMGAVDRLSRILVTEGNA